MSGIHQRCFNGRHRRTLNIHNCCLKKDRLKTYVQWTSSYILALSFQLPHELGYVENFTHIAQDIFLVCTEVCVPKHSYGAISGKFRSQPRHQILTWHTQGHTQALNDDRAQDFTWKMPGFGLNRWNKNIIIPKSQLILALQSLKTELHWNHGCLHS